MKKIGFFLILAHGTGMVYGKSIECNVNSRFILLWDQRVYSEIRRTERVRLTPEQRSFTRSFLIPQIEEFTLPEPGTGNFPQETRFLFKDLIEESYHQGYNQRQLEIRLYAPGRFSSRAWREGLVDYVLSTPSYRSRSLNYQLPLRSSDTWKEEFRKNSGVISDGVNFDWSEVSFYRYPIIVSAVSFSCAGGQ